MLVLRKRLCALRSLSCPFLLLGLPPLFLLGTSGGLLSFLLGSLDLPPLSFSAQLFDLLGLALTFQACLLEQFEGHLVDPVPFNVLQLAALLHSQLSLRWSRWFWWCHPAFYEHRRKMLTTGGNAFVF